ncbi:MAG: Lrp/AsnC family transcriptional regulator [Actinobacteria bacterium]|nr:Lrp/AsnC family transcriptional regulator [Actinomycetota bacterium]
MPAVPSAAHRRPHIPLDEADHRIIELLTADGRASNRMLAAEVDLTEATVATRLRRLVDQHVLGVTAIFDWEAAGYRWDLWLAVVIEGRPPREVAGDVAALPHVHSVSMVLGPFDLIVHVVAPDRPDVVTFLTETISAVPGVREVTADVTLAWVKYTMNWAALPAPPVRLDFPDPAVELDELDQAIISALAHDGRQSNREISRQLGVSDGTIRARLRRMEEAGMLRITAQVDPYRVGTVGTLAFLGVETEGADTKAAAETLAAIPEISMVAITAGCHDLFVHAATAMRARLVDLIVNELRELPAIRSTETWEVVSSVTHDYRWVRLLPGQAPAQV